MSTSIDIESKINISIHDPSSNDLKEFKLLINLKGKKTFKIIKKTFEKYCTLIENDDNILLQDLISFELIINNKILNNQIVNIRHNFNIEDLEYDHCYVYRDDDIYIEFLKDDNSITCVCYVKKNNKHFIFNTPPNY